MTRSTDSTGSLDSGGSRAPEDLPTGTGADGHAPAAYAVPVTGLVVTIAACILLRAHLLPLGVPGQWYWPLRVTPLVLTPSMLQGLIIIVLAAAYVISILRSGPRRTQVTLAVALCTLGCGAMMMGLYSTERYADLRTAQVTCSISALPYFGAAIEAGSLQALVDEYVRDYTRDAQPERLRTHPPAATAYYLLARRAILGSEWLTGLARSVIARGGLPPEYADRLAIGRTALPLTADDVAAGTLASILITIFGALTPAACFFLATAVLPLRHALQATVLSAVIPSLLIVAPGIEGTGVVLALSSSGALLWAARLATGSAEAPARRPGALALALLSGLLWAAAILWTVGLLAVALPVGAVLLRSLLVERDARAGTLLTLGVACAGFVGVHAVIYLVSGYSLPLHLVGIMSSQRDIMAAAGRDRLTWTWMNLYDFALFLGPALTIAAIAGTARLVRSIRTADAAAWLCLGGVAALVLLDLSGTTRGEVGRIWVFLMPFFALTATRGAWAESPPQGALGLAILTLAQVIYAVVLYASIVPVGV